MSKRRDETSSDYDQAMRKTGTALLVFALIVFVMGIIVGGYGVAVGNNLMVTLSGFVVTGSSFMGKAGTDLISASKKK